MKSMEGDRPLKLVTVVGARPQFIKAFAVSRAINELNRRRDGEIIKEVVVHTGQHYDYNMAEIFFDQLKMKKPDYHLGVGSGPHGRQTGDMLRGVEEVLEQEKPDLVLVYGDTNSTLAGALAAVKMHLPVAHVEAGLRSFRKEMPEEVNRVLTDHISALLFCPSISAVENLRREGFTGVVGDGILLGAGDMDKLNGKLDLSPDHPLVINVGDVMYDAVSYCATLAERINKCPEIAAAGKKGYFLLTLHRAENTGTRGRLAEILSYVGRVAKKKPVFFPVHPRTANVLNEFGLTLPDGIRPLEPLGYLEMLSLTQNARAVLTDSGGLQKEAMWLGVPCVTLREETEWVETIQAGWNRLWRSIPAEEIDNLPGGGSVDFYGRSNAAEVIAKMLELLGCF